MAVSFIGLALLILAVTALLLPPRGGFRSKKALDEKEALLPPGVRDYGQEYARKFSKQPERLKYPYSVVSGGVANVMEARLMVLTDPVVRAHYRRLDLGKLRPAILGEDKAAYVSYRKGDEVFWTSRKVRLFKGEAILTDGTNTVRGRCGNLVSDTHVEMKSLEEPPEEVLDTPALRTDAMAEVQPSYVTDPWEPPAKEVAPLQSDPDPEDPDGPPADLFVQAFYPSWSFFGLGWLPSGITSPPRRHPGSPSPKPPFITPTTTGEPTKDPDPKPPPVPEPSTWLLAGAGTLGLLWLGHSNRRRGRSR